MNALVLGLYAEGRTDERFLPILIQRTTQSILDQHDRMDIDAQPVLVIKKSLRCSSLEQCILQAAREAYDYDALVVHSDGDDRGYKQTLQERFYPGSRRVQQAEGDICKNLIPVIPIRMIEAWMFADPETLQKAMNTTLSTRTLRVPAKAKLVESITYPKETLHQIIQKVYSGQPRRWSRARAELYETLAPIISLDRLNQVPSYKQFVTDLTATLKTLNLIQ